MQRPLVQIDDRGVLSCDEVVDRLRVLGRRIDGVSTAVVKQSPGLYPAMLHYFGSLVEARAAIGVPGPPRRRKWTTDVLVRELRRLHAVHGRYGAFSRAVERFVRTGRLG